MSDPIDLGLIPDRCEQIYWSTTDPPLEPLIMVEGFLSLQRWYCGSLSLGAEHYNEDFALFNRRA